MNYARDKLWIPLVTIYSVCVWGDDFILTLLISYVLKYDLWREKMLYLYFDLTSIFSRWNRLKPNLNTKKARNSTTVDNIIII